MTAGHRLGRGQEDVRRHNLSALLRLVHERGDTSRAELTERLGLNRSTVADLVGSLVEAGLVSETPPGARERRLAGSPRTGRPSLVVRPRSDRVCVLAVYADVLRLEVARVSLGGAVLGRVTTVLPPGAPVDRVMAEVADAADALLARAPGVRVAGVGVAVSGTVRQQDGLVVTAPNLLWREVPVGAELSRGLCERLGAAVPVRVGNDADLGVLSEQLRGAARGVSDAVYLCGRYGIGAGVVVNGLLLHGRGGYAGEVGHLAVNPTGRTCRCGSRGCWETEVTAPVLAEPLSLDPADPMLVAKVLARVDAGDETAAAALDGAVCWFAVGLASIVNLLNPQVIVLGGGLWHELWPRVRPAVLAGLQARALPASAAQVTVRLAGLGADSTLSGAAELAFEHLLADPLDVPLPDERAGRERDT